MFFWGARVSILLDWILTMEIRPETIEIRLEQDLEARKASIMAMLSHELKSPLHGITGLSSSLLDDTEVPLSVKKPLSMMQNCAKRLLDMVSDLEQNCWIFDFLFGSFPMGKSPKRKAF